MTALPDRFWAKVDKNAPNGCWQWTAGVNASGYGRFFLNGGQMAHRLAYVDAGGEIPKPLVIDHLCRNRRCVNPEHMDVVSIAENTMRGRGAAAEYARRTACSAGHPYAPETSYIASQGHRRCRICERKWVRDYKARKRAAQTP